MYFEIENTPEHIRRARRTEVVPKKSPKEECPRLILAPFSRPPQVVFDNVLLGTTCERELEVFNPSKQVQQITLGKALPPGLIIQLPGEWLVLEPETCYCLTMMWTPTQPTALRESIRFTNEQRGRYDVIVVLKSTLTLKGKNQPKKGFKTSPGKMKKKGKKSPVAIYKKKSEIIYNTTKIQKTVLQSTHYNVLKTSNKENIQTNAFNDSMDYQPAKNPFDSPTSINFTFDTSEIFSNMKKTNTNILQNTYDKSYISNDKLAMPEPQIPSNVLKPSNKQIDLNASELFDNLSFTPLKAANAKTERLNKGPQIVLSMNSDSELDDSLDMKPNKENDTHSIFCITSAQNTNKWLATCQQNQQIENQYETPVLQNKKIPNTSSPKDVNSPNFSMYTELSRISDMSFFPQRFSTERKIIPKLNNDTHDLLEDPNLKLNTDTFTKDSPNTPLDFRINQNEVRPPHFFMREPPKMRQTLFRESQQHRDNFERNYLQPSEVNVWNRDVKVDARSPPRSITPPLQSIPEESTQFGDSQNGDRSGRQTTFTSTFTMNRTFDKVPDRNSLSTTARQSWSKKSVRAEASAELWKIPTAPPRKSLKPKASISGKDSLSGKMSSTFDNSKTVCQNVSLSQVGNVYSQSSTVDPFLSISYFYDEEAVHKFEEEFKRWLNYILTPPADLESNIEQKIDVGKAWLENRNKEVPVAPTKEQVCSAYHNSRRLESLRKSARALLMSPEMAQVFQKLNLQIEKKLIAIRTDRNLHLDVGLQKIIMELLLSYNPLWLRIGLEAIYGTVLPLKSNSDIEGLTTFIIQRMFKNPHLKNKHSKSSAPNMLLPAYMEAIKKFTLKKFFMLVFFLDQAKQKKLISHDPCLFCRNAVCKESREIIIRFTRELIAGIGDITKHLRPIGYVVCHKQSYLDEYKYAVHNIALDIRDGVRITKVMEIILMKNGLLTQLRTPAISRLQKIHNVQVALNALKEANFTIVGDITAQDIADGHREKTLSLLWQLIHVLRAPLFEKAANVIQTWWRKKYEVIVEKRKEEERVRQKLNNAASVIQCWWRRIQYNRLVEWQMKQIVTATIVIQKYCRMWLCRTRLMQQKRSVRKIEEWYKSVRMMREAKATLETLRKQREELRQRSATTLQSYVRRWLCMKEYSIKVRKIVLIQSIVRCFLVRKHYVQYKKYVTYIQRLYKGKLVMRVEMKKFAEARNAAITIQSYFKMFKLRQQFEKLKHSVKTIEERYIALLKMRKEMKNYQELKQSTVLIQSRWRGIKCRKEYLNQRNMIVKLQNRFRAHLLMKKERENFLNLKKSTLTLQRYVRSYQAMKKTRQTFVLQRQSAITIQRRFRAQQAMKIQKASYIKLKNSVIVFQKHYKALLAMRQERTMYLKLKHAAILLQRRFRAQIQMKLCKGRYQKLRAAALSVQRRFRAQQKMKEQRERYTKLKSSCVRIQNAFRAYVLGKQARNKFLEQKRAATTIQKWLRNCKRTKTVQEEYQQTKQACVTIQRVYRAYIIGRKQRQEYIKIRTSTIRIQNYYRSYIEMKRVRQEFIALKTATVQIQRFYKSYLEMKTQRKEYLQMKAATQFIQNYYRRYRETKQIRSDYCILRKSVISIQRMYRSVLAMRIERKRYLTLKESTICIQRRYRAMLLMRTQRETYQKLRKAAMVMQARFRAQSLMKEERMKYIITRNACVYIQRAYRSYLVSKHAREEYLCLKKAALIFQRRYRALLAMRKERKSYLAIRSAAINVQRRFRAQSLMKKERNEYQKTLNAVTTIQTSYRAYVDGKKQRLEYIKIKTSVITIQTWFRRVIEARKVRNQYLHLRRTIVTVMILQAVYRLKKAREAQRIRRENAAICIQKNFRRYLVQSRYLKYRQQVINVQKIWRGKLVTRLLHCEFLQKRRMITKLQARLRGYLVRKRVQCQKEELERRRVEKRENWAASVIQAHYRGHKIRAAVNADKRVTELRRRWREGALKSTQESLKQRNEEAMDVLRNMSDIETVIRAFRSLELLTEVFPMMYNNNAGSIVRRVYIYMSVTNRSISSIEVLKSAAALLVNLTRHKVTGPKIYSRERIPPILKFMWRFSNSEIQLFCILCTYLWLFSKYDNIKQDLTEFLNIPENQKILATIKGNVERMKRMAGNSRNKSITPQSHKFVSHTRHSMNYSSSSNMSLCSNSGKNDSIVLPALEPDYGITRADKPRYFEDAHQAISCLFQTYNL
ncbi:abnormal spindle-like microcephaly-assoc'd, ASPM-SPD-2-Hydin domain-containing protein [Phthorimaea operculella]|nr:abnormal spindle-like microcephaly-assoc'd, ASPM-SPD-2-Hydin domain-containing protein [Phthorimaea operculella]